MPRLIAIVLSALLCQIVISMPAASSNQETVGGCSPIVNDTRGNVTITLNCPLSLSSVQIKEVVDALLASGAVPASQVPRVEQLSRELGIKDTALSNLFRVLGEKQVPVEDLDAKLRE